MIPAYNVIVVLCFSGLIPSVRSTRQQHNLRHRVREADYHGLCSHAYYSIEEYYAGKLEKFWMEYYEAEQQIEHLSSLKYPFTRLAVDGFPCVEHGCCIHSLLVRPHDSDFEVVSHALQEYAPTLSKLKDWKPATILDGGGNIGMASAVFAFLYPEADVITIEPSQENCLMAKYNTASFPYVRVQCHGLWKSETYVTVERGGDSRSWGWQVVESTAEMPGATRTATIQSLLQQHDLPGFDYVKIDIEGAEYALFSKDADTSWISNTSLLSIEIHGDRSPIDEVMNQYGMLATVVEEYVFYAKPHLHALLNS